MTADRPWAALLALAAALLIWSPRRAPALLRARALHGPVAVRPPGSSPPSGSPSSARRRWLLAGVAGAAAALLIGGGTGLWLGFGVVMGGERLLRREESDDAAGVRAALTRDLPAACDLLGVCLSAGVPVAGALAAVGQAVPAPLGPQLTGVAALYRLGSEPRRAWSAAPAELAALGRVLVRAGESGSAVVPALQSLAADGRAMARAATEAAVRRAGVWVLAPLGVCFLPAFLCLGVVPLVLGIAGDVFR